MWSAFDHSRLVVDRSPHTLTGYRPQHLHRPLDTVDPHPIAGVQAHHRIATAHHGWDAKLTRHDRSMRQGRTDIGHDRGRTREQWRPTDVGHARHQDLTDLQLVALVK